MGEKGEYIKPTDGSDSDDNVKVTLDNETQPEPPKDAPVKDIPPKPEKNVVDVTADKPPSVTELNKSILNETAENPEGPPTTPPHKTEETTSIGSFSNKKPPISSSTPKKSSNTKTAGKSKIPIRQTPKYFIPKKEPKENLPIKSEEAPSHDFSNTIRIDWSESESDDEYDTTDPSSWADKTNQTTTFELPSWADKTNLTDTNISSDLNDTGNSSGTNPNDTGNSSGPVDDTLPNDTTTRIDTQSLSLDSTKGNETTVQFTDNSGDENSKLPKPKRPKPPPEPHDPTGKTIRRKFKPKLYDFVLEDYEEIRNILMANERKFDDNFIIQCPQFAILLDHTIAVIWYFYRDWKYWNNFNVPQLEWAIKFLGGLVSHIRFPLVEMIHKQLQDLLFITYTEVPSDLIGIPESEMPLINQTELEPEAELPVTLKAMLNRAPEFEKYLSTTSATAVNIDITIIDIKPEELDTYAAARIQLMKIELAKLNEYERRYEQGPHRDAQLTEIIDKIKVHADEIVRVREELDKNV